MPAPIFVVGTMRSGSTLLRLILDSHDDIAIGEETGFAGGLAATRAIPGWRYGREWHHRLGWSDDELDDRLREFYSGMFERHALSQGKKRWGDKTPFHSWHMPDMARVFPDAVFVAIVRHPGAVVSSLRKRFHYGVQEAADFWTSTNLEILRNGIALGGDRFALCRYEDVVRQTEPTMRDLLDWLGEAWCDAVLRHQEVQAAKGAPRLVDGSTSTRAPIDPDRAAAWRQGLGADEMAVLRDSTGAVARFLGYDVDRDDLDEMVPDAIGPYRTILTGTSLAARHGGWRPVLSLEPRTQGVVVADMSVEDMAKRVAAAEASLARIRSRPVVRASDAMRRAQRRLSLPTVAELRTFLRRALRVGRRRSRG